MKLGKLNKIMAAAIVLSLISSASVQAAPQKETAATETETAASEKHETERQTETKQTEPQTSATEPVTEPITEPVTEPSTGTSDKDKKKDKNKNIVEEILSDTGELLVGNDHTGEVVEQVLSEEETEETEETEGTKPATNEQLLESQVIVDPPTVEETFRFMTVEAKYAISRRAGVRFYKEADSKADRVGSIGRKGIIYLLSEKENGWYFAESGSVRGFVQKKDLIFGTEAKEYVKKIGESKMITAFPLVERMKNPALTYTKTTAYETVVEKNYGIARDDLNILDDIPEETEKSRKDTDEKEDDGKKDLKELEVSGEDESETDKELEETETELEADQETESKSQVESEVKNGEENQESEVKEQVITDETENPAREVVLDGQAQEEGSAESESESESESSEKPPKEEEASDQNSLKDDKDNKESKDKKKKKARKPRTVGTLAEDGLCYILEDAGNGWVFVESGDVRGFVKKTALVRGNRAKKQVKRDGEEKLALAKEIIAPEENRACYYTLTSIQEASVSGLIRSSMIDFAGQFVGNPYVWGGTSLTNGADCSGFVQSIYAKFGYSLPRVAEDQAQVGMKIPVESAQPGDLIFYARNGYIYHVVMSMGGNQTVEAQSSATGIVYGTVNYTNAVWAVRLISDEDTDVLEKIRANGTGGQYYNNEYTTTEGYTYGKYLGNFKLTAYCACPICCGVWSGGPTASGLMPVEGRTVAMAGVPFGTKLIIGDMVYTVEDRGTPYGHVDVFMNNHQDAVVFGVQHSDVYLAEE